MTLDDLSELTGVSKLTLGNIERGETNPTLAIIWKISKGISLPLLALFTSEKPVSLYRAGEGLRFSNDEKIGSLNPSLKATILKCVGHTYSLIAHITLKVIM